jgi:ABC-type nickel/cobalt efflux system permease component RcnA
MSDMQTILMSLIRLSNIVHFQRFGEFNCSALFSVYPAVNVTVDSGSTTLLLTALIIGVTHTLMGPDHYVPFVALSKARKWSTTKTSVITATCGVGHVLGSIVLGAIGVAIGWSVGGLEAIESFRGEVAAWLLTVMGAIYLAWAIKRFGRSHKHVHVHAHSDGTVHKHEHTHRQEHAHVHDEKAGVRSTTAWSLFIIFVFGPCEAFIPLLLFPSVQQNLQLAVVTTLVFAVATIGTMMVTVYALTKGLNFLPMKYFDRYGHIVAGLAILACGTAIHLGL